MQGLPPDFHNERSADISGAQTTRRKIHQIATLSDQADWGRSMVLNHDMPLIACTVHFRFAYRQC
jgi:hypothetical protein